MPIPAATTRKERKVPGVARRVSRAVLVLAFALVTFLGWRWATGNFATVQPGRVYRSAQLRPVALSRVLRERDIKTVLNLRGPNPKTDWYPTELSATLDARATQIDLPLSSDYWLSREQAHTLLDVLDSCEYPVLVHCQFGAERTGLVCAFLELLRPGSTLADARAQFSAYYLFLPVQDGLVMRGHLDRYEDWLTESGLEHSPGTFRRWIRNVYTPGSPSREEWPYDPYPLKVVTAPEARTALR